MFFHLKIRSKILPDNIQWFGTKQQDTIGRKVSHTLEKVSDICTKLFPMAETAATIMGYGQEIVGFETAGKEYKS